MAAFFRCSLSCWRPCAPKHFFSALNFKPRSHFETILKSSYDFEVLSSEALKLLWLRRSLSLKALKRCVMGSESCRPSVYERHDMAMHLGGFSVFGITVRLSHLISRPLDRLSAEASANGIQGRHWPSEPKRPNHDPCQYRLPDCEPGSSYQPR